MRGQRQLRYSAARYPSFARLYADVDGALAAYVDEGVRRGHTTPSMQEWFKELSAGFHREFEAWAHYPETHPIGSYLRDFEQVRSKSLRLAAHAFLHVAYDLPRVIADTLQASSYGDRRALRSFFLRPAPLFRQMLVNQVRGGAFGAILRPLGFFESTEILGYWLLALRSVAWIHAESLADSPDRTVLEWQLAGALWATGRRARGKIEKLDNSQLFQATAAVGFPGLEWRTLGYIASILVATATATFAVRSYHQRIARRIDYFGALTYIESSKALRPVDDRSPFEGGALAAN
jgi:hypothetical protein